MIKNKLDSIKYTKISRLIEKCIAFVFTFYMYRVKYVQIE